MVVLEGDVDLNAVGEGSQGWNGGAGWVISRSCMLEKRVIISMMSAMWLLLWG